VFFADGEKRKAKKEKLKEFSSKTDQAPGCQA
jgi:hypothetical protein